MYGLSNYILGYYSNLMWLDCVMLLSVLAWSIEEMVHLGKWKKYTLVLGYCIISNYYFGFILCVFSVLYYQAVYAAAEKRKYSWMRANVKFAGSSILAGGLAAFILLPGVFAVAQTTAAKQAGISFCNVKSASSRIPLTGRNAESFFVCFYIPDAECWK